MARSRNIKPAFFDNEDLAELEPLTRLLFIGLWTLADREGRVENRPKRIKAQLFAYDDCDINEMLSGLSEFKFIKMYEAKEKKCIQIMNWNKHQNPHHKEVESILPADDGDSNLVCNGYKPMSQTIRNRIYERDGRICACCDSTDNLEIDHILPVTKGGNSIDENLQVLCKRCNVKKFDKHMNFKVLRKHDSSMIQAWVNNELTLTQEQVNEIASCPTDSLNLIPDSLNLIPETDLKDSLSGKPDDASFIIEYMNGVLNTKYKTTTKSHIENINARLAEGHTKEDLQKVIDFKNIEWSNDPKMAGYLRPQTLFQTGKFQGYLTAANAIKKQGSHNLSNKTYVTEDL